MSKGFRIFIRILAILLILMSLLLLIISPIGGIIGIVFGVLLIVYSKEPKYKPYSSKYEFKVAGLPYYRDNYKDINPDNEFPVSLIDEPENPHDSNAIKVMLGNYHIGYVPADECNKVRTILTTREVIGIWYYADWDEDEWYSVDVTIMYKGEPL